jgi:hypothetical protein
VHYSLHPIGKNDKSSLDSSIIKDWLPKTKTGLLEEERLGNFGCDPEIEAKFGQTQLFVERAYF